MNKIDDHDNEVNTTQSVHITDDGNNIIILILHPLTSKQPSFFSISTTPVFYNMEIYLTLVR